MKKTKAMIAALMMLVSVASAAVPAAGVAAEQNLNGTYVIRNVNSGLYMTVGYDEENNVVQNEAANAAMNSAWRLEADGDGYYRIYSYMDTSVLLNAGTAANSSDRNVCISAKSDADNQLFELSANADGSFKLISKDTGKAVEVINAEKTGGANIQQWEINGENCQDWELIPVEYLDNSSLTAAKPVQAPEAFTPGDVNDDGVVDAFDAAISKRMLVSGEGSRHQKLAANVSGNEVFDTADIVRISRYILTGEGPLSRQKQETASVYAATDMQYEEGKGISETTNAGSEMEAYLNLANEAGVAASIVVEAEDTGLWDFKVRFANGGAEDRPLSVYVNGQLYYWSLKGKTTGAWTNWEEETIALPLMRGANKITFVSESADGAPNLDTITIGEYTGTPSDKTPISPIIGVPGKKPGGGDIYGVGRQMEALNRGVVAANTGNGMLVSWRKLATDSANTTFKLYRNGTLVTEIKAGEPTNYFVEGGSAADTYTIDTFVGTKMTEFANTAIVLGAKNSGQSGAYLDIPLNKPADQTMPDGTTCSYSPNDCSVGDVDGDGEYEIIVKWDPSNSQDNSKNGYTGTVILDCYKINGKHLWRIDLGKNIRAGAHYTQFMVYDFDGDNKAELICKTADGTKDGKGNFVGDASKDYRSSAGRILSGPEYLTLFDGETGGILDTVAYDPERGNVDDWGDGYGNRCDRFLAGVAYFDGKTPSAIFARGYYTRAAIVTYDVQGKKLVKRWRYDTSYNKSDPAYGQGNHSVAVMDVDADGKDELIYGSCCIDDNGKLLWSTKLGHGDCMQAGDLFPERPGLEIFQVHEEVWCAEVHDAATGQILWRVNGGDDVGRGIALNMSANTPGMELTSTADGKVYYYNPASGKVEEAGYGWNDKIKWGMNAAVWWNGDLEREALDRTMVESPDFGRQLTADGAGYNNGTKSNASLTCDLFGDWREECIFPAENGTVLRVFTTTIKTDTALFTLMHDSQYRTGVAIENVAYNQSPNTSFFLGTGYALPETPTVYTPLSPKQ